MDWAGMPDILKNLATRYPRLARRLHEAELLGAWEELVGPAIAKQCEWVGIEGDVLQVWAPHPLWRQELAFLRDTLLTKVQARAPKLEIQRVEILVRAPKRKPAGETENTKALSPQRRVGSRRS